MDDDRIAMIPMLVFIFLILPPYIIWRIRGNSFTKPKVDTKVQPKGLELSVDELTESPKEIFMELVMMVVMTPVLLLAAVGVPLLFLFVLVKVVKFMWNA